MATSINTQFDLENHGEDKLYSLIRGVPPGSSVKMKGSGIGIIAKPGSARFFRPVVPSSVPDQASVAQVSLKSAREATDWLITTHKQVLKDNPPVDADDDA